METVLTVLGVWCVVAAVLGPLVGRWLRRSRWEREGRWLCTCGHVKAAHDHYRRGTDCAFCGCKGYVPTCAENV